MLLHKRDAIRLRLMLPLATLLLLPSPLPLGSALPIRSSSGMRYVTQGCLYYLLFYGGNETELDDIKTIQELNNLQSVLKS